MNRLEAGARRLFRTALIAIPIGVLGNVILSLVATDRELLAGIAALPRAYLALAVGLALLPWLTSTLRLLVWLRFLGYRLPTRHAIRATLAVELGSAVSPTAVGGDAFKWGVLVERGVSPGAAASVITTSKLEDAVFFAIALPLAVVATSGWAHPVMAPVAGAARDRIGLAAITMLAILGLAWSVQRLLLSGRFGRRARQRGRRFLARARRRIRGAWREARRVFATMIRRGKAKFLGNLLLTAVQWGARYSVITALLAFLGVPVDPVLFWLLQWLTFTLMSFMPTPGATGGAEAAFALIYGPLVPLGVIGVATAGWRFLTFYLQVGIAAALFWVLGFRSPLSPTAGPGPAPGSAVPPGACPSDRR